MQHSELSKYRLEQAERCLQSAKTLLSDEDYKGAANRSYYCVFHCMRSVMALESVDFKSHSAVISYFRKEYIKTNKLDVLLSDMLTDLFQIRTESDYDDFYILSKTTLKNKLETQSGF